MAIRPVFSVTLSERQALDVTRYDQGQWLYQMDDHAAAPRGYYQLRGAEWVFDNTLVTAHFFDKGDVVVSRGDLKLYKGKLAVLNADDDALADFIGGYGTTY